MARHDQQEFVYEPDDFEQIRHALYLKSGIRLIDSKDTLVYSRLTPRLRALSLHKFSHYLSYLNATPDEDEYFINALTTNLTSFFREPHHFDTLATYLRRNPGSKTIWCAASSTGEEAYSIAMTVAEVFGCFDNPVTIIASDIDSEVLRTAKQGIYRREAIEKLSSEHKRCFFHRGKGTYKDQVRIVPELAKNVSFRRINLMEPNWPLSGPVDIIFCRNVMIYFDKQTQLTILKRMVALMPDNGMYVAGHSENYNKNPELVTPVGKTLYRPNREVQCYG
ncbi:CheR family methyltransferase [Alteromonas sp. C1M14]|uniref:CheR family methyltransferase n=1 Tax=Alteromonas sp. C1M14 TaxID=2841567 RepID=UPI001C0942DE|nr:CheR family methyltransferase [Alteromonas sp. C1M14]MBU2979682.1 chemotaxis protein CheR [Alteromonas sp. C1M14]